MFARAPSRKGRRKPLELQAEFPPRRWQFAVKAAARLRDKGFRDVVVREITVTHEQEMR